MGLDLVGRGYRNWQKLQRLALRSSTDRVSGEQSDYVPDKIETALSKQATLTDLGSRIAEISISSMKYGAP